ncbi:hypothetical protein OROHE_001083 [Orobanche hederae]
MADKPISPSLWYGENLKSLPLTSSVARWIIPGHPIRFLHRHPPITPTSEDPYFISDGIYPFCANDEAGQLDLWYRLVGGVEKESEVAASDVRENEVPASEVKESEEIVISSAPFTSPLIR